MEGLTASQQREAERWIELYEHHDKYKLIGMIREEVPELGESESELATTTGKSDTTSKSSLMRTSQDLWAEKSGRDA